MLSQRLLSTLLEGDKDEIIQQPDFKGALKWIQRLTILLQNAQRALYGIGHTELLSAQRVERVANFISHHRRRTSIYTKTLYETWKLSYSRPVAPRWEKTTSTTPVPAAPPGWRSNYTHVPPNGSNIAVGSRETPTTFCLALVWTGRGPSTLSAMNTDQLD